MEFLLERFEYSVYRNDHETAGRELLALMQMLDSHYGNLANGFSAKPMAAFGTGDEVDAHVLTRIASAISHLFLDPNFKFSPTGFAQVLPMQRWLATLFAVTPFRNADHVLRALNNLGWQTSELQLTSENLNKFALLAFPESEIPINLDGLWQANPVIAVTLGMLWLAPRFLASQSAHSKRELILGWLPDKLQQMNLDDLPSAILHDVYMHCSYADRPDRHRIKGAVNVIVRNKMLREGLTDVPAPPPLRPGEKPTMLIVLEWFSGTHSIYRTHSSSIRAAREHFHVIGMGMAHLVDAAGREVFDEFELIDFEGVPVAEQVRQIRRKAEACQAQVLYQPGVGMFPHTIFTASLRLAPLQLTALGHSASTLSPQVDYFAVDEDFIGDESTFTEKLLRLPPGVMPMVPSAGFNPETMKPVLHPPREVVRIAVAASTMKLNPGFLACCRRIADSARTPVHFEILAGQALGLVYLQARNTVRSFLGDRATLHMSQAYEPYMAGIAACDLFINPFPYGNMNGMADMAALGMMGVCRGGPQVHQQIDAGLFRRLGLPEWAIASDVDSYVAAAVRLIDQPEERLELRRQLIARGGPQQLNQGDAGYLGRELLSLWQQQVTDRPQPQAPR